MSWKRITVYALAAAAVYVAWKIYRLKAANPAITVGAAAKATLQNLGAGLHIVAPAPSSKSSNITSGVGSFN